MRQTGRIRARFAALARTTALYVLAGAIWAVVLCEPADAPSAWPATAATGLYDDLNKALAERTSRFADAASRSAPAVPAEAPGPAIVWPARGVLTGWFGEVRGAHRHPGVDIDGATGDPVVAAAAGRVVAAGPAPPGYAGYGTVVMIDHGDGLTSISAHLSQVTVTRGQHVEPGTRVGAVGTSGSVTGSHLHFELRRRGVLVDPRRWLPAR
ncbi:MAG TPA: M23 family metallopeptidase [Acidimicrobiales bacterium]|nr:M23 family metallopeptidase [Acidimicrobiales bacterium]